MRHKSWYRYSNGSKQTRRLAVAAGVVALVAITSCLAHSAECPQGVPRCKVLVLTPDMEQALVGPNMILDTAEWGNRAGLGSAVQFFKKAIADAPAGEVKKPEEKK